MPPPTLIVLCLAGATFLAAVALLIRGALHRPARRLSLVVTRRTDAAGGIFCLTLQRPFSARWLPLPRFVAGQSVQLGMPGEACKRRYSVARWSRLPFAYELTIKREPQGRFSPRLAEHAQTGARLFISRPGGQFTLPSRAEHRRVVFIAGGVGITPLLAMLDQWAVSRRPYGEVHLYWQIRHEQEAVYRDVLAKLTQRRPRLRVRILVSRPVHVPAEKISVDLLVAELGDLLSADFYLCASTGLLDSMLTALGAAGVAADALHFERFTLGAALEADDASWTVDYAGERFFFAGHASLLDAIEARRLAIDSDCRAGSCGRCLVAIESGQARHRITAEYVVPSNHILACCAVPESDIRLCAARAGEATP